MNQHKPYLPDHIHEKKILFCVLNWGLGHATRSAALIEKIKNQNNDITIASDGEALFYLKGRFPEFKFIELPSYNVTYSIHLPLAISLLTQIPHFYRTIKKTNSFINSIVHSYDIIISDNRYGCYHKSIPSFFISHQLTIQAPIAIISSIINREQNKLLKNFNAIWVPDDETNLSGRLSHTDINIPVYQIGLLSLFKPKVSVEKDIFLLVIISGPEPARSDFEKRVIRYCRYNDFPAIIVGGKLKDQVEKKYSIIDYRAYCPPEELNDLVSRARKIICRAGYSTLMDIFQAQYKGELLLVPTPGQTEQEYLAQHLAKKFGYIHVIPQSEFFSG